ncbi:succinyl-diaminopimelate desuccinylase [Luminiphilus sp.]|nr:succinyl-diaminopimelate desuccinylase [Luminiphilus sp.]MDB2316125.1 succinyl-diaminopimelate desuccinylase [Luminiphilus sp.]MDB2440108.1 succinyl-diaminopimelate desuccinylase [Luminiphilus sp.]MDB2557397.1 succinyl-diaminopimelate desuccinylase [Luminiphilus sp.]MDB2692541.1 succinyl-diaminopimelate desuccinylase [Luminiphilus sp.]
MPITDSEHPSVALTKELISKQSVTPADDGCQPLLAERLSKLGFNCESLPREEVLNLWATRGTHGPTLVFAGHTDVVPPGPREHWDSDPFVPTERAGFLYGRGAADMKASLAAMVVATESFVANHPNHRGRIGYLITADEEGPAIHGTRYVVDTLQRRGESIDWCVVGEPSSTSTLGDIIKNGRRGSINATLTIKGKQGHVAYPHLADNPMHKAFAALTALSELSWDSGNDYFDPTQLQFSNIHSGTGATNVIPGELVAVFNLRFSTEITADEIQSKCEAVLDATGIDYSLDWQLSGNPFLTEPGDLVDAVRESIMTVTGVSTQLSTGGGTSDGRFIATMGSQIIELGPINASIHQRNEHVLLSDIPKLARIYEGIMERLLT